MGSQALYSYTGFTGKTFVEAQGQQRRGNLIFLIFLPGLMPSELGFP